MSVFDCSLHESFHIGRDIRVHLTGRVDDMLYVFIDAAARHELGGVDGFHASAPSGMRRTAHVLAMRDADAFTIGDVRITVDAVRLQITGAYALRAVRLRIEAPSDLLQIAREAAPRAKRSQRLAYG
jgi:hypothetical protein